MRSIIGAAILTAILISLANAEWRQDISKDKLSGEKIVRSLVSGTGTVSQHGRNVTTTLMIGCANLYNGKPPEEDYFAVLIVFSEMVGIADVRTRYKFDNGSVKDNSYSLDNRGRTIAISSHDKWDGFFDTFRNSKKLSVEPDLAWAGKPLLEFNTTGASKAMVAIPCGKSRAP